MICPNCGNELEKGICTITTSGLNPIFAVFQTDEERKKKGFLNRLKSESFSAALHTDDYKAYFCRICSRVTLSFDVE